MEAPLDTEQRRFYEENGYLLVIPAGLFFDYGWILVLLGIGDAAWGVVYLKTVPERTGRSITALLLDRPG